jgi:hypothetical protein
MSHYAGKNGNVYTGSLLVEDCEDAWNEHVNAHVTGSADAADYKVGAKSAKFEVVSAGATELLASEVITKNLQAYDILYMWIKCTINTAAGDLQILLDDTGECASALKSLNVPALVSNVWTRIALPLGDASGLGSLISVGLYQVTNLADCNIWLDDLRAVAMVDGIKAWSLDYVVEMLETTDFGSAGVREYIAAGSGWSGSFEGLKDGVPLGIGSEVVLVLAETGASGQCWLGDAFITAVHPAVSADGIVEYSYDFQGTGALQVATI